MQDIAARRAPQWGGAIRRLFAPPSDLDGFAADRAPAPVADPGLRALAARIDRVEAGTRLIAETMKRACGAMLQSVEALERQVADLTSRDHLDRDASRAAARLEETADRLAESIERFPYVVAAATADLTDRLDGLRSSRVSPAPAGCESVFDPTPVEVEPLVYGSPPVDPPAEEPPAPAPGAGFPRNLWDRETGASLS